MSGAWCRCCARAREVFLNHFALKVEGMKTAAALAVLVAAVMAAKIKPKPVGPCEPYATVCRHCTNCTKCWHCAVEKGKCSVCWKK